MCIALRCGRFYGTNLEFHRLDTERSLIKPKAVVALGATAARSLFGRTMAIGKSRGRALALPDGLPAFVTIHPSYPLRIEDHGDKAREYASFVADLRPAAGLLRAA
jgi:uracil-DNA glycosylase